jgi:hypothetical protein
MIMFAINYRKKATLDGVVAMLFLYAKTGVLAALYYMDMRVFGWMVVFYASTFVPAIPTHPNEYGLTLWKYAVLFIAVGRPKYAGPENIVPLNPATIEQHIKRLGGFKSTTKKVSWIVYFYADWSDHCLEHDAMIADLSLQYVGHAVIHLLLDHSHGYRAW